MGEGCSGAEVLSWLKTLPLAPEYHPTLEEFRDPIAYIFKIEAEASRYGICKIVPPVAAPPKKTAISNLNKSLSARPGSSGPTFTTRQQQIGFCPRKHRPVQKPVWQSGEKYTLQQFEAKAKGFEKNYIKRSSKKGMPPLEVESLYWKATVDKPFSVEYANDIPGSAFAPKKADSCRAVGEGVTVAETEWNMRGVSRANGSLLKFMKEEIPGVTSPMVYIAMMFSWFAWHVEDHDLHSLNYLHTGAGKTWYGVPRDAAVAFEEVIRVHGYGGEINPLVTFAILGEKTTVMSPEVLLNSGVPCCRLVQDVGEFVVTFPRAYHSGFSHGFNCGEASNIATPGWLRVAKDAAIRRASINCPPMVSHFQLLYDLALSFCSSMSRNIRSEPRSSRLKEKKKDEGETLVKDFFVQDLVQNNSLLHVLGGGSSVVLLPRNSANLQGSQLNIKPEQETTKDLRFDNVSIARKQGIKQTSAVRSTRGKSCSSSSRLSVSGKCYNVRSSNGNINASTERAYNSDRSSEHGLFSCVTCGILCYTCVAIVRPTKEAAHCLLSADFESLSQWRAASGRTPGVNESTDVPTLCSSSGLMARRAQDGSFDVPVKSNNQTVLLSDERVGVVSTSRTHKDISSLGLLASTYGDSSDSEEEADNASVKYCERRSLVLDDEIPPQLVIDPYADHRQRRAKPDVGNHCSFDDSVYEESDDKTISVLSNGLQGRLGDHVKSHQARLNYSPFVAHKESGVANNTLVPFQEASMPSDEDSFRMHVFCLQHAVEVEKQLQLIGGAHVFLCCHPDYPILEAEAKKLAGESGSDYIWSENSFHEATEGDKKLILSALETEEAIHGNEDWAVKLGINLFYSANLSRSTLYCKQMSYNSVIYSAFGRSFQAVTSTSSDNDIVMGPAKHKKISVAGKWCGKVWMSNQVHPFLAQFNPDRKPILLSMEGNQIGKKRKSVLTKRGGSPASEKLNSNNLKNKRIKKEAYAEEPQKNITEKNKRVDHIVNEDDEIEGGPTSRLRRRTLKPVDDLETKLIKAKPVLKKPEPKKVRKGPLMKVPKKAINKKGPIDEEGEHSCDLEGCNMSFGSNQELQLHKKNICPVKGCRKKVPKKAINKKGPIDEEGEHSCDLEGCNMSFGSNQELQLHKKNICPVKGCGKKFFSHKYLVQHRRVHMDERPLKCPWKGCKMTFKWAWARTEHIRVHTGVRPYVCTESDCGQTFRFVSDFSRHKRKTGHTTNK
ncbi:unnamed protein product [Cuscuta epithymum]|uniref:Lysine-specific demethylase REF6 n=1 Tax=Cuscuta epithymum TaxID=186058 RepID=A0AAV0DUV4_9ASTE|nr:unnamed protein product [Cuscuta epithymum]